MFSFTNRIVLFFTLMILFLLGLYGIGTQQQFLDGTFLLIARIGTGCSAALILVLLFAFFQMILSVAATGKLKNLLYFIFYLVALAVALIAGVFFSILLAL